MGVAGRSATPPGQRAVTRPYGSFAKVALRSRTLQESLPAAGWDTEFSSALEGWHAEHGVFLSEDSYRAYGICVGVPGNRRASQGWRGRA